MTAVAADFGRLLTGAGGQVIGTTTVHAAGPISGRIISRGNLVSEVIADDYIDGAIAAQGDLGAAVVGPAGHLTRFGGINCGNFYGQLVVLGNAFGDIHVNDLVGSIAVGGRPVAGLNDPSRVGILGNVIADGDVTPGAAVVSGGLLVDAAGGTSVSGNFLGGILAAKGAIALDPADDPSQVNLFAQAQGVNAAAIDAIFTNGGKPLAFDLQPLDLAGLDLMLAKLASLHVGPDGNLDGPVP